MRVDLARNKWLILFTVIVCSQFTLAGDALWTYKSGGDLRWQKLTAAGTLLVGTDEALICFDPETGKAIWTRNDFPKTADSQVEEVAGTPFLLVSKNLSGSKTALYAVDIQSGNTEWESGKLKGSTIGVFTVYDKDMTIIFTARSQSETKTTPDMIAFKLSTGEVLWENEFADKIDLHAVNNPGKFFIHFDLSGHQPPLAHDGSMYTTFAGLHRYDLSTGKLLWRVPYDVTEGKYKRANAQCVVDGDVVYTSAKGQLRAIDKNSGAVKWTSADFGAGIAEMMNRGNLIYGRMGGTFFDYKDKEWDLKKPLGVVAVNKNTGTVVWRYDKADDAITNMLLLEDQNTMLIADAKTLIGIDTTSEAKATELFRTKVEFKTNVGAAATALKVSRFALGGLQGGLKGLSNDKKAADVPIALTLQPNGQIVVRGRQQMVAFDPKSKTIPWSINFAAPGIPGWQKFAMISVYAMSYLQATAVASNTYYGSSENTSANNTRQRMLENYSKLMNTRFSATRSGGQFVHILTTLEVGKEKGPGIVGVNQETGQVSYQVLLKDKEPDYVVDEITGRLFNMKGKELQAFNLH